MICDLLKLELCKILQSKRLLLVITVLLIISLAGVRAEWNIAKSESAQMQMKLHYQEIERIESNILRSESVRERSTDQEQALKELRAEFQRLMDFELPKPKTPNAFSFAIDRFGAAASELILPILTLLIGSDLISDEFARGTIRLVFSSPMNRREFLAAKILSGTLYVIGLVIVGRLIFIVTGGLAFGFTGWDEAVQGFPRLAGTTNGQFVLMDTGLKIFAMWVVLLMGIAFSVMLRTSIPALVSSLAVVLSGGIFDAAYRRNDLSQLLKYLLPVHLDLAKPYLYFWIPWGPTFGIVVLSIYGIAFFLVITLVFTRLEAPA